VSTLSIAIVAPADSTDECSSAPCKNGGNCYDRYNDFLCDCATGYSGKTCDTGKNTEIVYQNPSHCRGSWRGCRSPISQPFFFFEIPAQIPQPQLMWPILNSHSHLSIVFVCESLSRSSKSHFPASKKRQIPAPILLLRDPHSIQTTHKERYTKTDYFI